MRESNRTMKQIISDAVERELAKEPLNPLTFEEFQALIETAEERRRKRYGIFYPVYKKCSRLYMRIRYR